MVTVRLRPVRHEDLVLLDPEVDEAGFEFFGHRATNATARAYAATGLLTDDQGTLVVEDERGELAGSVGWFAVRHGPASSARALNIGISLRPEFRGRGIGTAAQAAFADYLFRTTPIERLEAGTDVENLAEQRALTRAGFHREGVARHAQWRAGAWHDLVLFSRLRGDPPPPG